MVETRRSRSILDAETGPFSWKSPRPILHGIFLELNVFSGECGGHIEKSRNASSRTRAFYGWRLPMLFGKCCQRILSLFFI